MTKPLPVGAPLPPKPLSPHALTAPEASSAAKAELVDAMVTKPLPVGAPLPPKLLSLHALTAPEASNTAKAPKFACCPLQ
jgi:hypothetical protein